MENLTKQKLSVRDILQTVLNIQTTQMIYKPWAAKTQFHLYIKVKAEIPSNVSNKQNKR